jgi:mutator protein MutT
MIAKVADALIVNDDKILLVQQRKDAALGLWSYPGGRVEEGETLEQAVAREVQEELGAEIPDLKAFRVYKIVTSQGPLEIYSYTGKISGPIILKEDELLAYNWFSIEELRESKDLRSELVLQQAKDVIRNTK